MGPHHNDKTTFDLLDKKLVYPLHSKMSLFHLGMDIRLPFYSPTNMPNAFNALLRAAETQCRLSRGGHAFCGRTVLEQLIKNWPHRIDLSLLPIQHYR
jgi:hypothetical protein